MTDPLTALVDAVVARVLAELARDARPANDTYLSAREAADLARVSVYTVRRWVHDGKLTEHRAGKQLRVLRAEVTAMLEVVATPRVRALSVDERVKRRLG